MKADETKQMEDHEACQKEIEAYKQRYLRALADYKNLEQRTRQEREQMRDMTKRDILVDFLPVLDHLEQAQIFTDDPGLKMVSESFRKTLTEMGVTERDLLGTEFDPATAEAVEVVQGKQDNLIVEVLQKAYELNGQLIRHGRVKVSKIQADSE